MEQFNSFVFDLSGKLQHLAAEKRVNRIKSIVQDVETLKNGEPSYILTPLNELCEEEDTWDTQETSACDSAMQREKSILELQHKYSGLIDFETDEEEIKQEHIVKTRCGNSDLHDAVSMGDEALVRELILKGENPHAKNNNGHTPVFIAFLEENTRIISLFQELNIIQKAD